MNVTLSIKDDTELRKHIKAMIKGEITSIAREEIINIIKEVLGSRIKREWGDTNMVNAVVKEAIKEHTLRELKNGSLLAGIDLETLIQAEVNARLNEIFKKMGLTPEQLVVPKKTK